MKLVSGARATGLRGRDKVEGVALDSGQELAADVVVLGIGIDAATEFARDTGIRLDNGIVVDEFLETSVPGIYAAGDIANYRDLLFRKHRRTEHWDNAVAQGGYIAKALFDGRKPFIHVPYFFSDEFDLSYEFWGDTEDADQVVYRGIVEEGEFSAVVAERRGGESGVCSESTQRGARDGADLDPGGEAAGPHAVGEHEGRTGAAIAECPRA